MLVPCLFVSFIPQVLGAGWSNDTKVVEIYVHDSGHIYVEFLEVIDPDTCTTTTTDRMIVLNTSNIKDNIYAGVLSAKASNADISYFVDNCSGGYPILRHILIK